MNPRTPEEQGTRTAAPRRWLTTRIPWLRVLLLLGFGLLIAAVYHSSTFLPDLPRRPVLWVVIVGVITVAVVFIWFFTRPLASDGEVGEASRSWAP